MAVGGEAAHVGAQLGHDHLRGHPSNAVDRVEADQLVFEWAQALGDLGTQVGDDLVEVVDVAQLLSNQEPVMGAEPSDQRSFEVGDLVPHPSTREVSQG